jgi:hypothetical protein
MAIVIGLLLSLGAYIAPGSAQVIVPPQPANLVLVTVDAHVTFDSTTGLYTYSYNVTSSPSSIQEVWAFSVRFTGGVSNVSAPAGWTGIPLRDRQIVTWADHRCRAHPTRFRR